LQISQAGLDLIKRYESLRLTAYLPTPDDVPTIGWGHTKGVQLGDQIDEATAEALLLEDLRWVEECIEAWVDVALEQCEYDSLCSFVLNVGCPAFKNSTLCRLLNQEDYAAAAKQFSRWNKQGGKVLPGLTRRRAEEAALFTS